MVLFYTVAGVIVIGVHDRVSGDVNGIRGDVSGIQGDLDLSELTDQERSDGININNLIMEQETAPNGNTFTTST